MSPDILCILPGDFPEGNSANSRLKAIARTWQQSGLQTHLYFLFPSRFNRNGINTQTKGFYKEIPYTYLGPVTPSSWFILKIFRAVTGIYKAIFLVLRHYKHKPVIYLYLPQLWWAFPILAISRIYRYPLLIDITEKQSVATGIGVFKKLVHRLEEMIFPDLADHTWVISRALEADHRQRIPGIEKRMSLLTALVDTERFPTEISQSPLYRVGYLGSFAPKDGVLPLLDAFAKSLEQYPQLTLHLAGYCSPARKTQVQEHIHALNIQASVFLEGAMLFDDIPPFLNSCDLLIVNRQPDAYARFGFPTKLAEYLASGKPVIATGITDIPYYLHHQEEVWLIDPGDTPALAQAILLRYANYSTFTQMGIRGRQACVNLFSCTQHKTHLVDIVNKLRTVSS